MAATTQPPQIVKLTREEIDQILERAATAPLSPEDCQKLRATFQTLDHITQLLEQKNTTIQRLRQIIFGAKTEKTKGLFEEDDGAEDPASDSPAEPDENQQSQPSSTSPAEPDDSQKVQSSSDSPVKPEPSDSSSSNSPAEPAESTKMSPEGSGAASPEPSSTKPAEPEPEKKPKKGHGRNGAAAYTGATKIEVPLCTLQPGCRCPECLKGTLYLLAPAAVIRIVGQAPLDATVYRKQRVRCPVCGKVFTAKTPAEAGPLKYDATAIAMMAMLRYGTGIPGYRLEGLEKNLGIPLPSSTQYEKVAEAAPVVQLVHEQHIHQAAQGEVVYNDDTTVKILALMAENKAKAKLKEEEKKNGKKSRKKKGEKVAEEMDPDRTGMYTSGVVSTREGKKIALFFSGRKHAGENLADVLAHRDKGLGPPIQMCDALDRNEPKGQETDLSNCGAHARRQFVEQVDNFPDECRYLLEIVGQVYKNDAYCKEQKMSPEERLLYHQQHSGPLMEELEKWFAIQFDEHKVEPNSGLGKAISYMKDRWSRFTLFLRKAGAPLDNNIVERALKMAILSRKNSLFYKTLKGAWIGDMFMTLIHTCQLNGVNALDYITELLKHPVQVALRPADWMPWNYRLQLEPAKPEEALSAHAPAA